MSAQPFTANSAPTSPPSKPRMSATKRILLGGCLIMCGLFLVAGYAFFALTRRAEKFIPTTPLAIAPVAVDATARRELDSQVNDFIGAVTQGHAGTMHLSTLQLNQALNTYPEFGRLKGKAEVVGIEQGVLKLKVSIPLSDLGITGDRFAGRFLNGTLYLQGGMGKTGPTLRCIDLKQDDVSAPGVLLDRLRDRELVQELTTNYPETDSYVRRVKAFSLKDGALDVEMDGK